MQRVLLETKVAHLGVAKLALDHPKRMLHLGTDAGLELLHLVDQRVNGVVFLVQRFALTRAHCHMPGEILADIGAFVCALVARITKGVCLLAMQQAVALDNIRDVARSAAHDLLTPTKQRGRFCRISLTKGTPHCQRKSTANPSYIDRATTVNPSHTDRASMVNPSHADRATTSNRPQIHRDFIVRAGSMSWTGC